MKLSVSMTVRSNKIPGKIRGVKAATASATWMAAGAVLAEAQRRVRRGATLALLDSLKVVGKQGDATVKVGSVGGGGGEKDRGRPIARFIEMGTVKMHAHPFLRPGAAMGRKTLKQEAADRIKAEADK